MKRLSLLISITLGFFGFGCSAEKFEQAPKVASGLAVAEKPIFVKLPKSKVKFGKAAGPKNVREVFPMPGNDELL